jgi:hypothetical protein
MSELEFRIVADNNYRNWVRIAGQMNWYLLIHHHQCYNT